MLTRHKVLRLGAVSVASAFFTMSAVGATYACDTGGNGNHGKAAAAAASHSNRGGGDHADRAQGDRGRSQGEHQDRQGRSRQSRPSRGHHETSHATARHAQPAGAKANGSSRGNGHTPVTVCHRLGNGGYIPLTFDDNALKAHLAHGDLYPVPANGCPSSSAAAAGRRVHGHGAGGGHGHVPVTVCHLLGNGGYIRLTFDRHALGAHLAHGDVYPVPAAGCPSAAPADWSVETSGGDVATTQQVLTADHQILAVLTAGQDILTGAAPRPATVLGTEAIRTGRPSMAGAAAGSTAVRGSAAAGSTAVRGGTAASIAPAGGLLPNTGAAASLGAALLAGLALLGAGVALLTRKRGLTGR